MTSLAHIFVRGGSENRGNGCKRLTRYACTPFLSTAKEREERMPPLNPPSSRHAGASDAKIHKLAFGFKQYEFWPRPTLACRAADNAETHYPADCNVRTGFSTKPPCRDAACSGSSGGRPPQKAYALRLYSLSFNSKRKGGKNAAAISASIPTC